MRFSLTNEIVEQYKAHPENTEALRVVVSDPFYAKDVIGAYILASENGYLDLFECLYENHTPSYPLLKSMLRAALANEQYAIAKYILSRNKDVKVEVKYLGPIIASKNIEMFSMVIPHMSTKALAEEEYQGNSLIDLLFYNDFVEGVKLLKEEEKNPERKGEKIVHLDAYDYNSVRVFFEVCSEDFIDFMLDNVVFSSEQITSAIGLGMSDATPMFIQKFLKKFLVHPKQTKDLGELVTKLIETNGFWTSALEVLPYVKNMGSDISEALFSYLCEIGDFQLYRQWEQEFSNVKKTLEHLEAVAKSGSLEFFKWIELQCTDPIKEDVLRAAIDSGSIELVQHIIKKKEFRPADRNTDMLVHAIQRNAFEVVQIMLPYCNPYANNSEALYTAVCKNNNDIFDILLPVSNPKARQCDLLETAINKKNHHMIEALLPVTCLMDDDSLPLRCACAQNMLDLVKRVLPHSVVSAAEYRCVARAAECKSHETLLFLLELEEIQNNMDVVSDCVFNYNSNAYQFFKDCVSEIECKRLEEKMLNDLSDDKKTQKPRRRM